MKINDWRQLENVRVSGVTLVPGINAVDLTPVDSDIPIMMTGRSGMKRRDNDCK